MLEILLIEDNPADAYLVRLALTEAGLTFQLHTCSDGEKALRYLESAELGAAVCPHLLLLDLNIPKISGLEVLKAVRENDRFRSLPVIVLSSSRSSKDRNLVEGYGVNHFFPKLPDLSEFMKLGHLVSALMRQPAPTQTGIVAH